MPSPLTSSFASAAAGNPHESRRGEGAGGGEWSRSRTNGATQTFRRPSAATSSSYNREDPINTQTAAAYIPPHMAANHQGANLRNGIISSETRYNKDQMLSIYKNQEDSGNLGKNLSDIFLGSWNPEDPKLGQTSSWGKRDDTKDTATGPEICWDHEGRTAPLGLQDMDDEERELFTSSVNSPLKPPQPGPKDGAPANTAGARKSSVNQSHLNSFHGASPGSGRPGPRRRETGESVPGGNPLSPTSNSRFFRDDPMATPPVALLRRKTDYKDSTSEAKPEQEPSSRENAGESSTPLAGLKRSTTGPLSAGLNAPSSPWSTGRQSGGISSMGAFGSFSLGTSTSQADSADKRSAIGGPRGENRLKSLITKSSTEDMSPSIKEKSSFGALGRLPEAEPSPVQTPWNEGRKTRPGRSDTNPYGDEMPRSGSAALGGGRDDSPGYQEQGQSAFSALDTKPETFGDMSGPQFTYQERQYTNEPASPTLTNPYASPEFSRVELDRLSNDYPEPSRTSGLNTLREDSPLGAFGAFRRDVSGQDDRIQNTSTGPNRGFPSLSGLGGLGGISSAPWSVGTPAKERSGLSSGFSEGLFGPMSDLQSPTLGGQGGSAFFSSPNTTGFSRQPKMSSMFPPAMQEQMRNDRFRTDRSSDEPLRQPDLAFGGLGNRPSQGTFKGEAETPHGNTNSLFSDFGTTDASIRPNRGLEDNMPFSQTSQPFGSPPGNVFSSAPGSGPGSRVAAAPESATPGGSGFARPSESPSNQLPPAQQRQMVMPDRMLWIYRDPTGNTQGPWSGLEMHDWFKAGFFTAELQVKKLEDADFEPLAQLVRRIGNSREPFLVPQIGVPHGPVSSSQPSQWPSSTTTAGPPTQAGPTQPPFANSFPSFGTTLTAEQQNALERRKQEEQFLMARQKEHLAQQQVIMKQMQLQGGPHGMQQSLQHQTSAHSLHSQPSFGSITSPQGYQASPSSGPLPPPGSGFLEGHARHHPGQNVGPGMPSQSFPNFRDEDLPGFMERLTMRGAPQAPIGPDSYNSQNPNPQIIGAMFNDRARLQAEQQAYDARTQKDSFQNRDSQERLRQFQTLRDFPDDEGQFRDISQRVTQPPPNAADFEAQSHGQWNRGAIGAAVGEQSGLIGVDLKERQDGTDRSNESQEDSDETWVKVDTTESSQQPPRHTISPLPAPAAQRNRQHVADNLVAETLSQLQTPIETPTTSLAPWAEKFSEPAKGPSLKEIQEAEARKAAREEEVAAAAARRAQAEIEKQAAPPAPAPGLPQSSTWGNTSSATANTPSASVWSKPTTGKATTAVPVAATKKTLAQIQKEEETRKQRAAAAAAAANAQTSAANPVAQGKRYADLASKIAPPSQAWTTVGSGGKVKPPPTVVATPQISSRSLSGHTTPSGTVSKSRPNAQTARSTAAAAMPLNQSKANEEFSKWAKGSLGRGLNSGINVDDFVQNLLLLPPETEIISDSVYANSQTLDGRRFAEEFIRRRKLADKGIVDPSANSPSPNAPSEPKSGGGWSEIAKKGPSNAAKEETNSVFKVVAAKKKGKSHTSSYWSIVVLSLILDVGSLNAMVIPSSKRRIFVVGKSGLAFSNSNGNATVMRIITPSPLDLSHPDENDITQGYKEVAVRRPEDVANQVSPDRHHHADRHRYRENPRFIVKDVLAKFAVKTNSSDRRATASDLFAAQTQIPVLRQPPVLPRITPPLIKMTKTEVETTKMDTSDQKQDTGTQTISAGDTGKTEKSSTTPQEDSTTKSACKKHSKKEKKHAKSKKGRKNKHKEGENSDSDSSSEDSSDSDSGSEKNESSPEESDSSEPEDKSKRRKRTSAQHKKSKRKSHSKHDSSSEDGSSESTNTSTEERQPKRNSKAKLPARSKKARRARRKSKHVAEESEDSDGEADAQAKIKSLKAKNKQLKKAAEKSKSASKKNQKASPVKAKYKRVDHLWDEETHRFKLQDTVDDSDEAAYDKYAFTVRRCFDWEHKYVDTTVDIKSKPLKDALHHVMDGVSGISMTVKEPSLDPNMLFLFLEEMRSHSKELKKGSKTGKSKKAKNAAVTKAQHLMLLVKYIDKDYADIKKTLYPLLQNTTISFDLLWALYKPNSIVFSPTYGDLEEPRAFKIEYAYKQCHPTKGQYYLIEGQYLEFDGKMFGKGRLTVEVPAFKGVRKITNLNCYPLQYHEGKSALETRLIERGKAFVAVAGTHFRQYNGMAYVKTKKGVQKINTNGRVMVDPASFRRINPNYSISSVAPNDSDTFEMASGSDSDSDSCCCSSRSSDDEDGKRRESDEDRRKKKKYRVVYDKETDSHQIVTAEVDEDGEVLPPKEVLEDKTPGSDFSDEDLLIASPVALGFSFHDKTWLELKVSALTPITWNEDAFDSLVLPPQQKSIIRALVESHKFHPAKNVDDIISGKGKGLVAVLHGPPGTGKTLTAEGIAELLRCPLYMVSTGELGTDARTLERELQNILEITQVWGALLLLDEADVFLESRGTFDLHRNAMVGIFLRTLEYFQGIMFLTTNRVHNFDSAFQSRIHLALQYKELDFHARKNVWEVFFKRVKAIEDMEVAEFSPEDIEELARIDLNGRQIKNSTRMAQALSVNRKVPLSMKEVKEVLDVAREFKDYFVGGPGWKEAEHAYS